MPAVPQVTKGGPRSYVVVAGQTVTAGTFVEGATTGGRIRTAVAGSTRVLGVALQDAIAPEQLVTTATNNGGRPVLNMTTLPQNVAVAYGGVEVNVVFSAAVGFGEAVVVTAGGQAGPAPATPDARTIVGRCTSPNGVSGAGQVGLVRLAN
jgi:hypothetical protein